MKIKKYLVAASIAAVIVSANLFSYHPDAHSRSSQPPTALTGAPGQSNCTNCHSSYNVVSNSSSITVTSTPTNIFSAGYTPGTLYSITYTLAQCNMGGFEMTALKTGNTAAGTFALTNTTTTSLQTASSKQYVGHKNANSTRSWTFNWTAPAAGTGVVTFYTSGMLADGTGDEAFDYVHTKSWAVSEITTPVCNFSATASSVAVTCNGSSTGSATVTPSGGTTPYTYAWSNGATTATASNLAAGTYTVTVTESSTQHCTATASVTVTQPTALAATTSSVAASCGQSNGSATVTPSGGTSAYTYSWSSGATTAAASNLAAGTYSVTITDANNCTLSKSVTVTSTGAVPSSAGTIAGSATACTGSNAYSVTSVAGVTYTWAVSGGGTVTPSTNTANINWTTAGTFTVSVTPSNSCGNGPVSTLSVTVGSRPTAPSITGATSACPGAVGYSITQQSGTTYTWAVSGGGTINPTTGTNVTVTWATPGNYTVSVTPTNSCGAGTAGTLAVAVSNGGPAATTITGNTAPCPGNNTYTVPSSSGVTYTWAVSGGGTVTPNGNSATINWTALGAHTISVTPSNTCGTGTVGTLAVTVSNNLPAAPTISGSHTACTGVADAFSVPSSSGVTYTWAASGGGTVSPGTGNNTTVTWATPGTYTVSATPTSLCGTGTAGTYSVTVTQSAVSAGAISGNASVCLNTTPTYSISSSGGTYTWAVSGGGTLTPNGTSATVHWTALGTYTISVTPTSSCGTVTPSTLTVTVANAAIQPAITGSNNICSNVSTGYTVVAVAGETYTWSSNAGAVVTPNGATANILWPVGGNYNVSVTATNGCGTSPFGTKAVTVKQSPTVSLGNDTSTCQSITIDAGAGYSLYTWSTGASTQTINATTTANYSVTVNGSNGCTGSDSRNVSVTPASPITSIDPTTNACDSTVLDAGQYSHYHWSQGSTNETLSVTQNGTYSVTATDSRGCSASASTVVVIQSSPVVTFTKTISGLTVAFNSNVNGLPANLTWDFGDGTPNDTSANPTHTYASPGDYAVILSVSNNCGSINYGDVIDLDTTHTGIATVNDIHIKVYPNPVQNQLTVSLGDDNAQLELMNQLGEKVYAAKLTGGQPANIDMASLGSGIYVLKIISGNNIYTHKIVKEQ